MDSGTQDVSSQLKKIADHLVFLEKKLDTLLDQSKNSHRPFGSQIGRRDFQRPQSQHSSPRPGYRDNRYTGHRSSSPSHSHTGGFHKKFTPHKGT